MGDVYKESSWERGQSYWEKNKEGPEMDMGVKEDKPETTAIPPKGLKRSYLFEDEENIYRLATSPNNKRFYLTIMNKTNYTKPVTISLCTDVLYDLIENLEDLQDSL